MLDVGHDAHASRMTTHSPTRPGLSLQARAARRADDATKAQRNLMAAWGLAAVSLSHHMGHILHLMVGGREGRGHVQLCRLLQN
jgi:hypothetical protein